MELSNKVAIVTGGAKGIGFASGECLLRQGASVMLVDISAEALREATERLAHLNGELDRVV
jgi:NAD(P)-dependent dehydrogenase (short-subunit alcohol dehydrogenase family)